eukprot:TRINITY_DN16252_c1_g1_i2.p3 TRINITY_DN16252_c1_g1~~TRINITY_DN16252_c1_g1_i2.p3  ORF type:complete len:145 (-),score=12.56 TRINITY_DN16252_c1_g1_i2:165-599(-)
MGRSDRDIFLAGVLGGVDRLGEGHLGADAGQLDQHRQIHPGDHLDAGAEHGNGEIGRRSPEHVGENDDPLAAIDGGDGIDNVDPTPLHIVLGADADRPHRLLRPDDVFRRRYELFSQATVSHQHQADYGSIRQDNLKRTPYRDV